MITVATSDPAGLLLKVRKSIRDRRVRTWSYDEDEGFRHTASGGQWEQHAHLEPILMMGALRFRYRITTPRLPAAPKPAALRGVYHGRFVEMLVTHFRDDFTQITVSVPRT